MPDSARGLSAHVRGVDRVLSALGLRVRLMPYLRVIWVNPEPPRVSVRKPALTVVPTAPKVNPPLTPINPYLPVFDAWSNMLSMAEQFLIFDPNERQP